MTLKSGVKHYRSWALKNDATLHPGGNQLLIDCEKRHLYPSERGLESVNLVEL